MQKNEEGQRRQFETADGRKRMRKGKGIIRDILAVSGGNIIGRIRLQKIVYLLEQYGLGVGFDFSYHHYGPYSDEVSTEIERARFLEKSIEEKLVSVSGTGGFYSVYNIVSDDDEGPEKVGDIDADRVKAIVERIKCEPSMIAELAATIHWLKKRECVGNWKAELKRRKPTKATDENIDEALKLLSDLDISV